MKNEKITKLWDIMGLILGWSILASPLIFTVCVCLTNPFNEAFKVTMYVAPVVWLIATLIGICAEDNLDGFAIGAVLVGLMLLLMGFFAPTYWWISLVILGLPLVLILVSMLTKKQLQA